MGSSIYYIYVSNKNMNNAPMYIGQSSIRYSRIFDHIGAAYGVGINEKGYPTSTPATSNPAETIRQVGVSDCIYGVYEEEQNFYGLSYETLNFFQQEGWKIDAKDYLNFAEICHILVRRMNPTNALLNKTIGGEKSTFKYSIVDKVRPILTKYGLDEKKFGEIQVHYPSDPDYSWKILYPETYGAYRLLCEVVSQKVLESANWMMLIQGALQNSNPSNFLKDAIEKIFYKTAEELNNYMAQSDTNNASQIRFEVNSHLIDVLAKQMMEFIEGRLYYDAVYKAADVALKAKFIGYNITIKVRKGQDKLTKKGVRASIVSRSEILKAIGQEKASEQKPKWFTYAESVITSPPLNSLTSASLRMYISFIMMNIFQYYAEREIKNAPVFGRSAPMSSINTITHTNSNTQNLSTIPQTDWLKNRMYRIYSQLLGGGASTLRYWDRAYEQYASYIFGSNLTEINTLTLTTDAWGDEGGYIEKKPKTSNWVVVANINYANDPDQRFTYHFTPAQWSRIQQGSKISTNQINWDYL